MRVIVGSTRTSKPRGACINLQELPEVAVRVIPIIQMRKRAQRGYVTCLRLHSWQTVGLGSSSDSLALEP